MRYALNMHRARIKNGEGGAEGGHMKLKPVVNRQWDINFEPSWNGRGLELTNENLNPQCGSPQVCWNKIVELKNASTMKQHNPRYLNYVTNNDDTPQI